jgi:hypothetical protein
VMPINSAYKRSFEGGMFNFGIIFTGGRMISALRVRIKLSPIHGCVVVEDASQVLSVRI